MPGTRLKVVHTSDVHLDSDAFSGREREAARRRLETAFAGVLETVRRERANLFLVAGDLFDSGRVGRAAIDFALEQLSRSPCPVVLLPGNHDCYDERSVYRRFDFAEAGDHVHTLTDEEGQTLEFPDLELTVWGRPTVEHDGANRPLAGIPPRRGDAWHVGMAHGFLAVNGYEGRSSPITPEEIAGSGLDYLALGHVHVFREVSERPTTACYSGSPAPLHLGAEAGGSVAVVTLDPVSGVTLAEARIASRAAPEG